MKKFLVITIFVFFLFGFNGSSDAASLIEDLKNFEQSLSEWVANFNKLEERFSDFEKDLQTREKQIADFNRSVDSIKNLITDMNAKVDKVEKMRSASGIRSTLKEFEGTLNVFKRRFSEMAKRLEDQEVKTAVLGKIYDTAQRPLETLMQAIDEQKEVINNMANRLDEQGKALLAIEGGFRQILPAESPAKGMEAAVLAFKQKQKEIEEINARLSRLESGTIVLKTEETVEKKPEAEIKEKVVVSETPTEGAKAPTEKPSEMKGFTNIGGGFFIKNIELKPFGSSTYISGEIMNKSDRDYSIVDFKVQAYSEENDLLGDHSFSIKGFKRDGTKTFEEVMAGAASERIAKYFIFPAEMPLGSDMGEGAVEMNGKKLQVAMAETTVKQPQIEEGKTTQKMTFTLLRLL
jgi:Skp family chaperone for outer membrane proteins